MFDTGKSVQKGRQNGGVGLIQAARNRNTSLSTKGKD
jgi:hypothetical protein